MKIFKKIVISSLAVFGLILITACGKNESKQSSNSNGGKITVMLDAQPAKGSPVINALDQWSKKTGNSYKTVIVGYDDQLKKFPLMVKNNDLPDLLITTRLHKEYPEEFVDLGKLVDTNKFSDDVLSVGLGNYTNKTYILPTQVTITNYFYNKSAFKKAGLTVPTVQDPWTLSELYKNAEQLKKQGGVKYGFAVDYSRARYDNLMYSNGGSIVEKNGSKYSVAMNSPQNVNTLSKFVSMHKDGVMPQNIWAGGSTDNPVNYFENGDVGIYLSGSFNYAEISKNSKVAFGVMPSPQGSKQRSALLGGQGWGVLKHSDNSKTAQNFVKWFYSSKKNYTEFLNKDFGLPFMKTYSYTPENTFASSDYQIYVDELKNVPKQFLIDDKSQWGTYLDDEYRQGISKAVSGEQTPKQTLDNVASQLAKSMSISEKYK